MKRLLLLPLLCFLFTSSAYSDTYVDVATEEITPPIGTPSAGYQNRQGRPMNPGLKAWDLCRWRGASYPRQALF